MAKNKKNRPVPQARAAPAAPPSADPVEETRIFPGARSKIVFGLALALIAAGYALLGKADPAGRGLYSSLSPFLLLAGYLLIPAALYADARKKEPPAQ